MTMSGRAEPTLDQRRAKHAWSAVQGIKSSPKAGDFVRQAKQLPIRIMAAGLGHALAFVNAKKKAPELVSAIDQWVLEERQGGGATKQYGERGALMKQIIDQDADFLRWATEETLAYLQWLNRFAEAEIGADDGNGRD